MILTVSLQAILRRPAFFILGGCIALSSPGDVLTKTKSDLGNKQARKLLTRMAGLELPGSSVRIKSISLSGAGIAEVRAEIQTIFRLEKNDLNVWRVAEVRTGPGRWTTIDHIASALGRRVAVDQCVSPDPPYVGSQAVDPSVKRARCLIANLLAMELPSDDVRIQEVSPLAVPLASHPSAIVGALITVTARVTNDGSKGWVVSQLRAGSGEWINVQSIVESVDTAKQKQARADMETIAAALEKYRQDKGYYVISVTHSVAIDHLSPRYLPRVIREDPWQRPYKYHGERERFTLSSSGPDGKEGTLDDIELTRPAH